MRATRLLLCAALLVFAPACATLESLFESAFQKPELVFRGAQLRDASLSGLTLDLNYDLVNRNPVGLSLAEVDYALSIEGHPVVSGAPRNGLQIPADGTASLQFPANVRFQDIEPVLGTFLNKDRARYHAQGHLGVQTPIGILKFPIQYDGEFEVPKVPAVQFAEPRVTRIDFSGATVEFPLTVTNRNSYALPINGITGNLSIAGANVGTLSTGNLGALGGRQSKPITLPLDLNLVSAANAVNVLRNGGNAQVAFSGSVQSGAATIPMNFAQNLVFRR